MSFKHTQGTYDASSEADDCKQYGKRAMFIVAGLLVSVVFVVAVGFASSRYLDAESIQKQALTVDCGGKIGRDHQVSIDHDRVIPATIQGSLCDTMTIVNKDAKTRDIAFGKHNQHIVYDGVEIKTLLQDQSFTVVYTKTGQYIFHDHDQDEVKGNFTVR